MGETLESRLSRDELELVRYYRGLSVREQFEILESAEAIFNAARRMEELSGREVEKRFLAEEARWA